MLFKCHSQKIIVTLVSVFVVGTCLMVYSHVANREEGYALSGDGYIVIVTKKQFDEFGTGEFSDYDLEKFIERYDLEKTYPEHS